MKIDSTPAPLDYSAQNEWGKVYGKQKMSYPCEYLIRILKGTYPRLRLSQQDFSNQKICDIGFGDGRNMPLFRSLGFEVSGVEISQEIIEGARKKLRDLNIEADLRVGSNDQNPFDSSSMDYLVSWNVCYYMGENRDFGKHVDEMARVLRRDGYLILSVPKQTCFIYQDSEELSPGYQIIRNDPFNIRNGEVLRMFRNIEELKDVFSGHFDRFIEGDIHDDCFGFNYHWHLLVCQKKSC